MFFVPFAFFAANSKNKGSITFCSILRGFLLSPDSWGTVP